MLFFSEEDSEEISRVPLERSFLRFEAWLPIRKRLFSPLFYEHNSNEKSPYESRNTSSKLTSLLTGDLLPSDLSFCSLLNVLLLLLLLRSRLLLLLHRLLLLLSRLSLHLGSVINEIQVVCVIRLSIRRRRLRLDHKRLLFSLLYLLPSRFPLHPTYKLPVWWCSLTGHSTTTIFAKQAKETSKNIRGLLNKQKILVSLAIRFEIR